MVGFCFISYQLISLDKSKGYDKIEIVEKSIIIKKSIIMKKLTKKEIEIEEMISRMPFKRRLGKSVEESRKMIKEYFIYYLVSIINKEISIFEVLDVGDKHYIKKRRKRIKEYAETITFILTKKK